MIGSLFSPVDSMCIDQRWLPQSIPGAAHVREATTITSGYPAIGQSLPLGWGRYLSSICNYPVWFTVSHGSSLKLLMLRIEGLGLPLTSPATRNQCHQGTIGGDVDTGPLAPRKRPTLLSSQGTGWNRVYPLWWLNKISDSDKQMVNIHGYCW